MRVVRWFAYGSGLMVERLRDGGDAILSARPAVLRDHRLAVEGGRQDAPLRASATPALGGRVHGVLYEVTLAGLERLQRDAPGDHLVDVLVECSRVDGGVEVLAAKTFMAQAPRHAGLPVPPPGQVGGRLEARQPHGLPEPERDELPPEPAPKKPGP